MAKGEVFTVKDAVYRVQHCLLEGIQDENKLFAAGSVMSRGDYQDVVTERSIAKLCGYPLCRNILPSEAPKKGRYRISLKEHKVYDLQETYMYCSAECVINSRAFASSLLEERSSALNPAKLNQVLRLFEGLGLEDSKTDVGEKSKFGPSALKIQEKMDRRAGEVTLEEWMGPSNAIEGYVPQKDPSFSQQQQDKYEEGLKSKADAQSKPKKCEVFSGVDFTSTIIFQDEYSVSKAPDKVNMTSTGKSESRKGKVKQKDLKRHSAKSEQLVASGGHNNKSKESAKAQTKQGLQEKLDELSKDVNQKLVITDSSSDSGRNSSDFNFSEGTSDIRDEKALVLNQTSRRSSIKSSIGKKETRSVTWADEKTDGKSNKNLCEFRESEDKTDNKGQKILLDLNVSEDKNNTSGRLGTVEVKGDEDPDRLLSAEACARALTEAAEAVASGESDISNAISEAGIIVLPPPGDIADFKAKEKFDMLDSEPDSLKWPMNSSSSDSWYDEPPEGFNLALSPFATMYMALFAWTSSCSLAYIYGHDESLHEEYLCVNGREYPRKTIALDGRSSEIKLALSGCLARALPGLVTELRLPVPLSTLEKEMDHLLDTMSFLDPLPPFRMKQWQLVVLLFLDALSVCRIPSLTPCMTGRRVLLPKVFQGAQITAEEYEIMKDLLIPLGRVPQFAMQCGA
ncbi:OLC1v1038657C1 [Oldenlandia corymbosa var. corymbosa]|uniref:RNA polymerase II subunit B1 CTD phosphatase RPAP2 homolog n=1 Tax=Oldenlandia corymbosa var. corymbosa TaxID=529605 RepID=A0AAV1D0H1_OLDCO|nr:OLC1v1038657C1 [Oldenlandia corymbosa var. corymbosa]